MNGAAAMTTGSIVAQDRSHDVNQCHTKAPALATGKLAIAAAMADVRPA